jgi:hypothetical protein
MARSQPVRITRRRALALPFALALAGPTAALAREQRAVIYHAGWSIVAGPEGTRFAGAEGPLYALGPGDTGYVTLPAGTPAVAGAGYWAYFPLARTLTLAEGTLHVAVALPPGRWVLIGNPSGTRVLPVIGADAVFTYNPLDGPRYTGQLLPGQGAWAISMAGATIDIGLPGNG